jgi:F-type H+-transporting ATPase subunit a
MAHDDPLSPDALFGHVKDSNSFHVPRFFHKLDPSGAVDHHGHLHLPQPLGGVLPEGGIQLQPTGKPQIDQMIEPLDLHLTKFMVLEVVAALLCAVVFIWLARKIGPGGRPVGRIWNFLETFLIFLRDQVARPAIGHHDGDKFLPFIWTIFFFVLACNLLGMVPWLGSPTGALACTGALALVTFATVIGAGMAKLGPVGFWKAQVPHMDLPWYMFPIKIGIFFIEIVGLCIKHFVLAVRLLANMFAGHMVLAVLLAFIAVVGKAALSWYSPLFLGVSAASILGATALSLLELFVAFLQAYIFAFLSALFIGMAVHPH